MPFSSSSMCLYWYGRIIFSSESTIAHNWFVWFFTTINPFFNVLTLLMVLSFLVSVILTVNTPLVSIVPSVLSYFLAFALPPSKFEMCS